ncbi:MAG: DNA polymerase ligase N-terminal domain-containing protein [Nitrosopumilaceae archaeon]|nr:DNA polymerase ligase N-terminal domain-containing protein [Nitrosopumilaceae archaeon]
MSDDVSSSFCQKIQKKYKTSGIKRPVYVIQQHNATNLHWDLRLEYNKTLKSWALPKRPLKSIGKKRLAIQVGDHPIEYAKFEGEIPEGNYGSGKVTIWDRGSFKTIERSKKKWIVNIDGKKLQGRYCLLHFKPKQKNWLFFKMKDD